MDAEKIGFLRSKTSLLQIIGRAARNSNGKVVMYVHEKSEKISKNSQKNPENPENISDFEKNIDCLRFAKENNLAVSVAMRDAIIETYRRRYIQNQYNQDHGITPTTVISSIKEVSIPSKKTEIFDGGNMTRENLKTYIKRLELEMDIAAANLDFEKAAELRDELIEIKKTSKSLSK